jgi:uncharacterized protein YqgV (UPF0045/DUF77 family)
VETVATRAPRVSAVVKVDWRPSVTGALTSKVESIESRLNSDHGAQSAW